MGGRLRCYVAYSIDVGPLLPCSHASPRTSAVAAKSMPYVLCCNVIVEWVRALLHHVNVSDRLLVRPRRASFLVVHAELYTGVACVYDHGLSHSVILCCIVFVKACQARSGFLFTTSRGTLGASQGTLRIHTTCAAMHAFVSNIYVFILDVSTHPLDYARSLSLSSRRRRSGSGM